MSDHAIPTPTIGDVADRGPVQAPASVLAHLRDAAARHRRTQTRAFAIPDYDGLYVTFQLLTDYEQVRDEYLDQLKRQSSSSAKREIQIALKTLTLAAVGAHAEIDGVKYPLPAPWLDLYGALHPSHDEHVPRTDTQALLMLFDQNTLRITALATRVDMWLNGTLQDTEDEALGE